MRIQIFRSGLYWAEWALDLVPSGIWLNRRYSWAVQFGDHNAIIEDKPHRSEYRGGHRWRTIQSASHIVMVEAWAEIRDAGRILIIRAGNLYRRLESGPDHFWQSDSLGIALVRISDQQDYHPSAEVLLAPLDGRFYDGVATVERLKRSVEWVAQRRAAINYGSPIDPSEAKEVWVSLKDSLAAGNCREGSRQWAIQKRINIHHHHPATKLLELDEGNQLVRAAVKVAIARHKREMNVGLCELKDHTT